MIANRKEFYSGVAMMAAFLVVLGLFFAPLYEGHNGLAYLDNLYNSISKGSANYADMVRETAAELVGTKVEVTVTGSDLAPQDTLVALLRQAGAETAPVEKGIAVSGDIGLVLQSAAEDIKAMYDNNGAALAGRYQMEGRKALYSWWHLLRQLESQLKKQKLFAAAKDVALVTQRGVETAYNYYGVEAQSIGDRIGVVIFSLVFYVTFTLWYGFAILFMFEGWGLKLEH